MLDLLARPAPVAALAAREVNGEVVLGQGESRRAFGRGTHLR
jgi:hypothetical protein